MLRLNRRNVGTVHSLIAKAGPYLTSPATTPDRVTKPPSIFAEWFDDASRGAVLLLWLLGLRSAIRKPSRNVDSGRRSNK
jgi:hypothetical protein